MVGRTFQQPRMAEKVAEILLQDFQTESKNREHVRRTRLVEGPVMQLLDPEKHASFSRVPIGSSYFAH